MLVHAFKRLLALVVVLVGVISLTFVLLRSAPGDPFLAEKGSSPEVRARQMAAMKLDGALSSQLGRYFADVMRGDLRESMKYKGWRVSEILAQSLPVSFRLGGTALILAALSGIGLGVAAAVWKGRWPDITAMSASLAALSLPPFVTGPLLTFVFALTLKWFPLGGWFSPGTLWLPALCLAAASVASIARLTRNSLLDVLPQDFIRTATAKGLSPVRVVGRHALKVALLPVITLMGPLAANLLTGSVVVEAVFGVPGAGQYFVRAIENRDFFLLLGVVIVYCTLLVGLNFLVDLMTAALDRRIQLS
jgi:oligopeptide transport system permease protein